jgi:hypothetical protein
MSGRFGADRLLRAKPSKGGGAELRDFAVVSGRMLAGPPAFDLGQGGLGLRVGGFLLGEVIDGVQGSGNYNKTARDIAGAGDAGNHGRRGM